MALPITDDMRDARTPPSVEIRSEARTPEFDPTLGIPVPRTTDPSTPTQRLVVIGDSLSHGFQSGAIFNTDLSYPAIIAWEMGWERFRYPRYPGHGGLPLNLEFLVRELEGAVGSELRWWETGKALFKLRNVMDQVEDYWERGAGSRPTPSNLIHNLSVYGWDLRDHLDRSAASCRSAIGRASDDLFDQVVEDHNARAALRVLPGASARAAETTLDAARRLQQEGGIETLIVMLGANNALPSVVRLEVHWSQDGYDDVERKAQFTVWDPVHFQAELDLLVAKVKEIGARHVIWGTVPHVTVAPIARGVDSKIVPRSRYFPYYTRPWISDADFDPNDHPRITAAEARAIDSAIDQYNDAIVAAVRAARTSSPALDWYVMDVAGLLDRLAQRRYIDSPAARPEWWTPYPLPPALAALVPPPNSRFFASAGHVRTDGGLFSLDGVHPTTIAYGILAQEYIRVMQLAGVKFFYGDGKTERGNVEVDFKRLITLDTLISDPPALLDASQSAIGWLDTKTGIISKLLPTAL